MKLKDILNSGYPVSLVIVAIILIILGLAIVMGIIGYYLLSIAFPEYIEFGWYWIRFLALGFLMMIPAMGNQK